MTATETGDGRWVALARVKLQRICGEDRGQALLTEAMAEAGLRALLSADDLAKVADVLIKRGGFVQAVGFALQFQAILHGARRP